MRCLQEMQRTFGLTEFRPGQEAAISALLAGRDLLCILPTGAGKSLCWQLPAIMQDGMTIVVSPLIALMRDQVQQLHAHGINACTLDSLMTLEEREAAMQEIASGGCRIVFVSPERLETHAFRRMSMMRPPAMLVVDEAHCVVRWGEEFRPAYLMIKDFIHALPVRPVICALTATADQAMQKGISEQLDMKRCKTVRLAVIRENIHYHAVTALNKTQEILRILNEREGKTVVFCRSRARTERLAASLQQYGYAAAFYHAGMDRESRLQVQQRFSEGKIVVLAATTAFGMGVDIPDIRCVIHDYLPDNVIDFVQQSGRAGRDRLEAYSYLILTPYEFLNVNKPLDSLRRRRKSIRGRIELARKWRPIRQIMTACVSEPCIPAALSACLFRRTKPCGCCSACLSGPLRRRLPPLHRMRPWQVRAWMLAWQRERIAARENCLPVQVMSDSQLNYCAKQIVYPEDMDAAPDGIIRMIRYLRQQTNVEE